jgi:hypothetical protein
MAAPAPIAILPTTRTGSIGAVLAAFAVVIGVLAVVLDSPTTGRNPWAFTWALVVLAGGIELFAIARRHERSLLAYVALLPFSLLLVLLVMEFTGLME